MTIKCAEIDCLNKALGSGIDLRGATLTTVQIRGRSQDPSYTFHPPCSSKSLSKTEGCETILKKFGISVISW